MGQGLQSPRRVSREVLPFALPPPPSRAPQSPSSPGAPLHQEPGPWHPHTLPCVFHAQTHGLSPAAVSQRPTVLSTGPGLRESLCDLRTVTQPPKDAPLRTHPRG